jgi:DNA-directed RNA polymerase specialized sigma24 family protein
MRSIDPSVIDRCVAAPAELPEAEANDPISTHRAEVREAMRVKLARAMARLPPAEVEGLQLCAAGMRQVDAGHALNMSQQRLSYRMLRAQHRLRVAVALPPLDAAELARVLATLTPKPLRAVVAAVLLNYWQAPNAGAVGRAMGLPARSVARHAATGIARLSKAAERRPELGPVAHAFVVLRSHKSVLGARGREAAARIPGSSFAAPSTIVESTMVEAGPTAVCDT